MCPNSPTCYLIAWCLIKITSRISQWRRQARIEWTCWTLALTMRSIRRFVIRVSSMGRPWTRTGITSWKALTLEMKPRITWWLSINRQVSLNTCKTTVKSHCSRSTRRTWETIAPMSSRYPWFLIAPRRHSTSLTQVFPRLGAKARLSRIIWAEWSRIRAKSRSRIRTRHNPRSRLNRYRRTPPPICRWHSVNPIWVLLKMTSPKWGKVSRRDNHQIGMCLS